MSADYWAVCPRCLKRARATHTASVQAVMDSYGQVPVAEFDAARAALIEINPEDYRTFREDYEFHISETGEWSASYGGSCETCGLEHNFSDKQQLDV